MPEEPGHRLIQPGPLPLETWRLNSTELLVASLANKNGKQCKVRARHLRTHQTYRQDQTSWGLRCTLAHSKRLLRKCWRSLEDSRPPSALWHISTCPHFSKITNRGTRRPLHTPSEPQDVKSLGLGKKAIMDNRGYFMVWWSLTLFQFHCGECGNT